MYIKNRLPMTPIASIIVLLLLSFGKNPRSMRDRYVKSALIAPAPIHTAFMYDIKASFIISILMGPIGIAAPIPNKNPSIKELSIQSLSDFVVILYIFEKKYVVQLLFMSVEKYCLCY